MILVPLALALTVQVADTVELPPIVTVARHADSAARLPLAATAFTVGPARAVIGRSFADLLSVVPGLFTADRGNPSRDDAIAIRGVGARAAFGVRGVRVFLNGIPQSLPDGQTQLTAVDPATVERVEVLRGAASAWYGNAAGGALLFTTAAPTTTGLEFDVRAGAFETVRVGAGGAVGDGRRGLRLDVARESGAGWRRHASWETWRAGLTGAAPALGGRLNGQVTVTHQPLLEDPGALTADQLAADPREPSPLFLNANARKRVTHVQGGTAVAWRRNGLDANVAVWGQVRDLRNPLPFVDISLNRRAVGARASVARLMAASLLVGGGIEAQTMRDDRYNLTPDGASVDRDQVETATEVAPWVQGRWVPAGDVTVVASARFDAVRFTATDQLLTDGDESGARTLTAPSLALGVSTAVTPAIRPWAGIATIFETPTTTELTNRADGSGGFNPDLDPERGVQVEMGVRGDADGRAHWEAVVWRAWVRDALVPYESPTQPGRVVYRNAGDITREGVEVSAGVRPTPLVSVDATFSANDYRYGAFTTDAGTFDGNIVPGVPRRRAMAQAVVGTERVWTAVQVRSNGSLVVNDANSAAADGWVTLAARAGGAMRLGGMALRGWIAVENLLDARYVGAAQINANGGRYFEPGSGRALTVSLNVSRSPAGRSSSRSRSRW